ncbi:MFS general substrate transporter [Lecanosticta acicola]|uniref:MFS general substrate transporter n=1 Tax=Lecanosticta acicola TaxID=111012 RepID=A0AAI9EBY6_9PEZI|nr:MFS general substrate transporter [Lecanosticta acicola]
MSAHATSSRANAFPPLSNADSAQSGHKGDVHKGGGHVLVERTTSSTDVENPNSNAHLPDRLQQREYRVYKRRFWGLAQLVLLNIVISWDWLTFAAVSDTSSQFFRVSESAVNWLSIAFLFAFVAAAPFTIWLLNHHGPKASILLASILTLAGNWIRYAGTRAGHGYFGVVMFGQILIGLAQPFVLASPTRYSQMWFSDAGRVSATAVASLANPLGGALGQLIGPLWATNLSGVPDMVLYTSIISTLAALPAPFIPAKPPTPPSATAALEKLDLRRAASELPRNGSFYLLLIPFSVYVGCFNSVSSLINQIFEPYGFSETDAGIAGGLLIIVGLIASAIVSPIIDRTKAYLITIKTLVPLIAICYILLIFMPGTRNVAGPFVVSSILGATSFALLPVALELLSVTTLPVSPEVSSVIAWTGGQILGAIFIIVMDALIAPNGWHGEPPDTATRALIFQAVMACIAVPFPMLLGLWNFRKVQVSAGEVRAGEGF